MFGTIEVFITETKKIVVLWINWKLSIPSMQVFFKNVTIAAFLENKFDKLINVR